MTGSAQVYRSPSSSGILARMTVITPASLHEHAQLVVDRLQPVFLETGDRRVGRAIRELLAMQAEAALLEAAAIGERFRADDA